MFILDTEHNLRSSPQPMAMEEDSLPSTDMSSKKRKRAEPESLGTIADSLTLLSNYYSGNPSFMTPAPSSPSTFTDPNLHENLFSTPQHTQQKQEQHGSKRIHLSPKSRRPPTPASQLSHEYFNTRNSKSSTSACHICHRRPTTTSDLAAYLDCETCHERTCFVCLRTCEASSCRSANPQNVHNGHEGATGKNVCGKCCVEIGVDGRVWCLQCYEDDESQDACRIGPTKKELQNENVGRIAAWLNGCGMDDSVGY